MKEAVDSGASIPPALEVEARRIAEGLADREPGACPRCGGERWQRDGTAARRRGRPAQIFRCGACGKKRVAAGEGPFRHPIFPPYAMVLAVLLRRAGWTLQGISESLVVTDSEGQPHSPNRQTVARWLSRLAAALPPAGTAGGGGPGAHEADEVDLDDRAARPVEPGEGGSPRVEVEDGTTRDTRIRLGTMVGRQEEMASIEEAIAGPAPPVAVWIEGVEGIGKTRLVDAWRARYERAGGEVLEGRADALVRALTARLGGDHPLVRHHGDVTRRLLGEQADGPVAHRPQEGLLRDRDAVLQLLAAGLPPGGVLVVDALERADEPTLEVLCALLAPGRTGPRVVMASRPLPPGPRADRAERWLADGAVQKIALGPLEESAVLALVTEALEQSPVAQELGPRLAAATEGNPRFVVEILRGLVEQGAVRRADAGAWEAEPARPLSVPQRLVEVCRLRLGALDPAAEVALRRLAVSREPVPEAAAVQLGGRAALRALEERELVISPVVGEVSVAHDGLREAALWGRTPESLREDRIALAQAIEHAVERDRPVEVLAEILADAGELGRALPYVREAARRARERFDIERALTWLERLDAILGAEPDEPAGASASDRESTLRDMARMLRFRGRHEEQSVCLDRLSLLAQTEGDTALLYEVAALKALFWFDRGRPDLARQIARGHLEGARQLGDERAQARFYWVLAMVERISGDAQAALALSEQSAERLAGATDPEAIDLLVQNHINRGNAFGQQGHLTRAVAAFEEALEISDRHRLLSSAIVCTMNLGICHAMQCRYARALETFDRARTRALRLGWRELGDTLEINQAEVEHHLGNDERAAARLEPVVQRLGPDAADPGALSALCTLAASRLAQGDRGAAAQAIQSASRRSGERPGPMWARIQLVQASVGLAEATPAAVADAKTRLQAVARSESAPQERATAWIRLSALALAEGDAGGALELADHAASALSEGPRDVREGVVLVLAGRARAQLAAGHRDPAAALFERAVDELLQQSHDLRGQARDAFLGTAAHKSLLDDARAVLGMLPGLGGAPTDGSEAPILRELLALPRALARAPGLSAAVDAALDHALHYSGMQRGRLYARQGERMVPLGARRAGRAPLDAGTEPLGDDALERLHRAGRAVWPSDGADGLLLPLSYGDRLVGALALATEPGHSPPTAAQLYVLDALSDQVASILQHHLQVDEIERLRHRAEADLTRTRARLAEEEARRDQAERALMSELRTTRLRFRYDQIVHRSAAMRELLAQVDRLVDKKITVLVCGESGTGKELIARAMHYSGPRQSGPFVAINCGAIPPNLVESELFGHVRGAFTGATKDRRGHFELAHQGTLFLDEVGELAQDVQVRLLRVLETREVTPVGSSRRIKVDLRIVAATHRDLPAEVSAGRFREDLLYRINTITLNLPPLRDRPEDIPALVHHFTEAIAEERAEPPVRFGPDILARLQTHSWPGNVRELRNVVQYATLFAEGGEVPADLKLPF
jgi:transcriptional regulator with AAA-type ATPase domain